MLCGWKGEAVAGRSNWTTMVVVCAHHSIVPHIDGERRRKAIATTKLGAYFIISWKLTWVIGTDQYCLILSLWLTPSLSSSGAYWNEFSNADIRLRARMGGVVASSAKSKVQLMLDFAKAGMSF